MPSLATLATLKGSLEVGARGGAHLRCRLSVVAPVDAVHVLYMYACANEHWRVYGVHGLLYTREGEV